jgi:hypothetical protein
MGQSHSFVNNRTAGKVVIVTFNKSDKSKNGYNNFYTVDPEETLKVEAGADPLDPTGLYVGVVYKVDGKFFFYKKWLCLNESTMFITKIQDEEIQVSGGT